VITLKISTFRKIKSGLPLPPPPTWGWRWSTSPWWRSAPGVGGIDLGKVKIAQFCGEMVPVYVFSTWFLLILTDLQAQKRSKIFVRAFGARMYCYLTVTGCARENTRFWVRHDTGFLKLKYSFCTKFCTFCELKAPNFRARAFGAHVYCFLILLADVQKIIKTRSWSWVWENNVFQVHVLLEFCPLCKQKLKISRSRLRRSCVLFFILLANVQKNTRSWSWVRGKNVFRVHFCLNLAHVAR